MKTLSNNKINNNQEVIEMKERIEKIMSCAVTTTSYKLHQMNLLRGDAIVAHDFTYLKEIEGHIEALQNVLNEGKKIHFNRRDKNILIEDGIDINLEFREEMKALKHDLNEGYEYAVYGTNPCEVNASMSCDICSKRYNCSKHLATLPLNERLAIQRIDQSKYASSLNSIKEKEAKANFYKAKDAKKRDIAEATHLEAKAELKKLSELTSLGHEANLAPIEVDTANAKLLALHDAINHCEDSVVRHNVSKRICLGNGPTMSSEILAKAIADFNRKNGTNVPVPSMSEVHFYQATDKTERSEWYVDIEYRTYEGSHVKNLAEIIADKNKKREKALKENPLLLDTLSAKPIPDVTIHDIYSVLPDASPREEIGFNANSPLVITSAKGADYEAIVNSIGTKAYPLVKNLIENKVRLPEEFSPEAFAEVEEMNHFDMELSSKSHKEVATILSELLERVYGARNFFQNCTEAPFVDKGAVATGTKTVPFASSIDYFYNECSKYFNSFTALTHDETPISESEYQELVKKVGLCNIPDQDDEPLTKHDYEFLLYWHRVNRTKSVTIPVTTESDILKHQAEVAEAHAKGTDTNQYHYLYSKVLGILDTSWIESLLGGKFSDQSEARLQKISICLNDEDDDDAYDLKGTLQRKRSERDSLGKSELEVTTMRPVTLSVKVSDVLRILRRIENLKKSLGNKKTFSDSDLELLQKMMGKDEKTNASNFRDFFNMLSFSDIAEKIKAVLVREIGEHYVVTTEEYLNIIYDKYYRQERRIINAYASMKGTGHLGIDANGKDCHILSYIEFREKFFK